MPSCALCLFFNKWRNYDFLCSGRVGYRDPVRACFLASGWMREQRGRIKTLILKFIGWHRLFETYHSPRKRSTQIARSTTESKVTFIFTRYLNKLLFTTESQVTFIFTRYLNKWFHCSDYLSKRLQVWSGDESTYRMLHCNVKTEVHVLQYSMI